MSKDLVIKDLHISVQGKPIIKGLNLSVKQGEIHALMGPKRIRQKHPCQRFDGTSTL